MDKKPSKYSLPFLTAGSKTCFGAIGEDKSLTNGAKGFGVVNLTVYLSIFFTTGSLPSITTESRIEVLPKPSKIMFCHVKTTSSAVISLPSDHLTPRRRVTR